jgi:hypothetical protein
MSGVSNRELLEVGMKVKLWGYIDVEIIKARS